MDKCKFLLFPLSIGVILIIYSWYLSYPLTINSLNDFVFNNISIFYWLGLPLTLATMLIMAVTFKSHYSKWIIIVSLVITIYSLSYFYYMLPGSDSHYFRGLTEYFIETRDLDPTKQQSHYYFQWPSLFLLSDIATSVSGIPLPIFEFLLYTIIGFLLATALYVYASKKFRNGGCLAPVAFFIAMFYFLNYQCVPFSLAFSLLLLMFMLETRQKTPTVIFMTLILFIGIAYVHAFVPLFFILYLLIAFIFNRSRVHGRLFVITLVIYLIIQTTQASYSFEENIQAAINLTPEYSKIAEVTQATASIPIDTIAQTFSRLSTVTVVGICFIGFIMIFIKKKLENLGKAIFLTGVAYSAIGTILSILGSRAIPLAFMPISLGAAFLLETKFKKFVIILFLALSILFTFISIHSTFHEYNIMFQTEEAYKMENFMINRYNWTRTDLILAHFRVITYLRAKQPNACIHFENDRNAPLFPRVNQYDSIVYTVGLGKNLLRYNYTTERILSEEKFNIIYNNGLSYIGMKS